VVLFDFFIIVILKWEFSCDVTGCKFRWV